MIHNALTTLISQIEQLKVEGKKIVLTNGCFDILHKGHVAYMAAAKAQGDILIVAVNLDDSVSRLKPGRPYNTLNDRMFVLDGLASVDFVVPFDAGKDTADHLIEGLKPDVYVKGGDYTEETLPETPTARKVGCELCFMKEETGYSTTNLINKIRQFSD